MNYITSRMAAVMVLALVSGCKEDVSGSLQGQTNTTLIFHGLAVDQDGTPLSAARFTFRIEAYPHDWTFSTRGRDNIVTNLDVVSDAQGRFALQITGCKLVRLNAVRPGYRHLHDEDSSDGSVQTHSIGLMSWGQQQYKSDPDLPAVFVFVKKGVKEVSALPSRGGYYAWGKEWRPNQPAWPKKPSLPDVVYKPPATRPGQLPAEPPR